MKTHIICTICLAVAHLAINSGANASLFPPISDITNPGDSIIAIDLDGGSSYPGPESPANAIDNTLAKYLNFGEENSGLIVTPSNNPAPYAVTSLTITTANDGPERDPTSYTLWGTNDPITSTDNSTGMAESWTLISSGALNLPLVRNTVGPTVEFDNSTHWSSFRLVFPTVRNASAANSMQIAEIQLGATVVPEPSTLILATLGFAGLLGTRRRRR